MLEEAMWVDDGLLQLERSTLVNAQLVVLVCGQKPITIGEAELC